MRKNIAIAATIDARPSSICCKLVTECGQAANDQTYKKPSPASQSAHAVHVTSDETCEKAGHRSCDWD